MTVLLVRHAVARPRARWDDDDTLRPLTTRGARQAEGLVKQLSRYAATSVLSSPSVRCIDTVIPIADKRGLDVEVDRALAEGGSRAGLKLVRDLLEAGTDAVLCSHGDVIPDVVEALGFNCGRCAKGSTWILDGKRAMYLPPPD
ncbi:MAG TPA: phosphoglycerate mutase family protein [Acidimicrobiales bacterium]|nr:phosphoglycerate mutase family protein [Acidimicrobiales bacterium]